MIPRDYVTEWRSQAPWVEDAQVEQDLVICRALIAIFSDPTLSQALAFRGGTALSKLYLKPGERYSEDIDLVQKRAEPAGPVMDALRLVLDPWLGAPRWKQGEGRVTFMYRFASEGPPSIPMRLKIEINSREHFSVFGFRAMKFAVSSRWYEGDCEIQTFELEELLGTKMRALYQRKKGRDLFDLATALSRGGVDAERVVQAFMAYMRHGGHFITRSQFERNLHEKIDDEEFVADLGPLLAAGSAWDFDKAFALVLNEIVRRLPGETA